MAAIIIYSPLLVIALAAAAAFGTTLPNRLVQGAAMATVIALAGAAIFLYLVVHGVAVVYIDRRAHPGSFSFWRAVGSTLLVYVAVLLPLVIGGAVLLAVGSLLDAQP